MERRRRGVDPLVMSPVASSDRRTASLLLVAAVFTAIVVAVVTPARAGDAPATSANAAPEIPLPELPTLRSADLPKASREAVKGLETRLEELVNTPVDGPLAKLEDRLLVADLDDEMVPAIAERLARLKDELDGAGASRVLEQGREVGRKAIRSHRKEHDLKKKDPDPPYDWLVFVLSLGDSADDTWRGSVELYGMLRMLEAIGTTPAVRVMIEAYSYFGELVRIDLQRSVERLKDKAVPALIEAKKHDARRVRRWARLRLEGIGRAIPGEAVSTTDPDVLADVLRAFGRVRDVDATRVVMSFASSERLQLREAAREAIAAIGEPAWGHYKDSYKSLTGERPPRAWDYKRTVQEIFRIHDQSRLAKVYATWEQGKRALADGKHAEAATAFDHVLARAPLFEHRAEMAPAYLGRAEALIAEKKWDEAAMALRKAQRLQPKGDTDAKIASRLATLEARSLLEAGTPDRSLLERAVELDPDNAEAKNLLATFEQEAEKRQQKTKSYGLVIGVAVTAVVLLFLLWLPPLRRMRRTSS